MILDLDQRNEIDALLFEMEVEGDGWYGRASGAIKLLLGKINGLDQDAMERLTLDC